MAMLGKELLRRVEDRRARAVGLAGFLHSIPLPLHFVNGH
jgi:hypothetical protein